MSNVTRSESKNDEKALEYEVAHLLSLAQLTPNMALSITKLDLFRCNLSFLPKVLPEICPQLKILFLMENKFTQMPAVLGSIPRLEMISFKSNALRTIHPDALQPQLRWLILTNNQLESIPSTIGRCTRLQKLMLAGNQLKTLPQSIEKCVKLELVRLSSNQLEEAPSSSVLSIPSLSWIALSDNPFLCKVDSSHVQKTSSLQIYDRFKNEGDIENGELLGRGASGITRKVLNKDNQYVAVKKYSAKITSDGNPVEEKKASIAATSLNCQAFISIIGEAPTCGSLVMELLDGYKVLAGPPSMTTCSRDVYEDNIRFSSNDIMIFIRELIDALDSIHSIGLCHGDFYGHNILYRRKQNNKLSIKLTDFGAAFFYDRNSKYGQLIEIIEMRAFGILVEELMNHRYDHSHDHTEIFSNVVKSCLSSNPSIQSFKALSLHFYNLYKAIDD